MAFWIVLVVVYLLSKTDIRGLLRLILFGILLDVAIMFLLTGFSQYTAVKSNRIVFNRLFSSAEIDFKNISYIELEESYTYSHARGPYCELYPRLILKDATRMLLSDYFPDQGLSFIEYLKSQHTSLLIDCRIDGYCSRFGSLTANPLCQPPN